MQALNLSEDKTEKIMFSEFGEKIEPGDTYFEVDYHGRRAILSLSEYETQVLHLRDFSAADRKKLAKSGAAMSDGSYPIENCQDAVNASRLVGQSPASKRPAIKAHIAKRRKALGCSSK